MGAYKYKGDSFTFMSAVWVKAEKAPTLNFIYETLKTSEKPARRAIIVLFVFFQKEKMTLAHVITVI